MKQKRTERQEIRLTPEEKAFIQEASLQKGMTISAFMRHTAVEMAKSIALNKSPQDTYYAVLMSVGQIAPEVAMYSASADFSPMPEPSEENDEGET